MKNTDLSTKQHTLLIVEDEANIREMLCLLFSQAGFKVMDVSNAEQAWNLVLKHQPDCVLLDWTLPGISGLSLLRRIRHDSAVSSTPIVMLTARNDEEDQVKCLDMGADDYVAKPFSPRALVARIEALMRRVSPQDEKEFIRIGNLSFNLDRDLFLVYDQEIVLAPTEHRIMRFLMTHSNRVYSRLQLLDVVWGQNVVVEERTVDVHIRRLRQNLEPLGVEKYIRTVRGVGYILSNQSPN